MGSESDTTERLSMHTSKIVGRESGKQSCYKVPKGKEPIRYLPPPRMTTE